MSFPLYDTLVRVAALGAVARAADMPIVVSRQQHEQAGLAGTETGREVELRVLREELKAAAEREAELRDQLEAWKERAERAERRPVEGDARECALLRSKVSTLRAENDRLLADVRARLADARAAEARAVALAQEVTALRHEAKPRPRVEIVVDNGWDD